MKMRWVPILLGVWMVTTWASQGQAAAGEHRAIAASPAVYYVAQSPGAAIAVPKRACRRGALPAYAAVYTPPRYLVPGVFAPWGSLPAGFYAASYPLVTLPIQPGSYRPPFPVQGEPLGTAPGAPPETLAPPGPEAIPAPAPMELKSPDLPPPQ